MVPESRHWKTKISRSAMVESCIIGTADSRGFYIAADGAWYLYSDGIVRHGATTNIDGATAFWATEQAAIEFYSEWVCKQESE